MSKSVRSMTREELEDEVMLLRAEVKVVRNELAKRPLQVSLLPRRGASWGLQGDT